MANIFKFGIEEEFFLVDADTKSAARAMPAAFLDAAKKATGGQVSGELLQSQVEIATLPHTDMATAREELRFLRQAVAKIADEHGLAILAAGTHPTAAWRDMQQTESERYDAVMAWHPEKKSLYEITFAYDGSISEVLMESKDKDRRSSLETLEVCRQFIPFTFVAEPSRLIDLHFTRLPPRGSHAAPLQLLVQLLEIACRVFVEQHQVHGQPLAAPVGVGREQQPGQR